MLKFHLMMKILGRIRLLQELGVKDIGKYTSCALKKLDEDRLRKADTGAEAITKQATRVLKRRKTLKEEEDNADHYSPG
ncbi:hypothetical protein J6590_092548, partial [Homalodisca vitripennis]